VVAVEVPADLLVLRLDVVEVLLPRVEVVLVLSTVVASIVFLDDFGLLAVEGELPLFLNDH